MTTAAEAAKEFATGPQVVEAARLLLSRFSLPKLCEELANARPDDADPLISALERLAAFEEVRGQLLSSEDVLGFLRQGGMAPDPRVRRLVARLLTELVCGGEVGTRCVAEAGLLAPCEPLMSDPETGIAEAAAGVLREAVRWPAGRQVILGTGGDDGGLAGQMQGRLRGLGDTERMRLLHLFVELGRSSDEAFKCLESRGVFREVVGAFITDDILLKLVSVELMDALGSFQLGQELLSQHGIPEQLARDLMDPMCDDSVRLCVARLLGFILLRSPEAMGVLLPSRESPFAQAVAGLLESRDQPARLCGINAWANASAHAGGLAFFLRWPEVIGAVLAHVESTQNEVCKGAMACWAAVLEGRTPPGSDTAMDTGDVAATLEAELWTMAEARLLPSVLKNLKGKPFADVRVHTWQLLAVLSASRACAQHAVPSEEMRDIMLDFTSETSSDARIAKHEFIVALQKGHASWLNAFLDEKVADLLAEYARQGPHWAPRDVSALVGDQSGV